MKRNVGFFATCSLALALSACGGGGVQSPDFNGVLNGVVIEEVAANTLTVDVGATLQLRAFGLYTLPPGASGEPCGQFFCTRGSATGVTWSVTSQDAQYAIVDGSGVVRGIKRKPPTGTTGLGVVEITARIGDLPSDTANIKVDGEVLKSLVFTPSSLSGTSLLPVPVGITQPVAIQGQYTVRGEFSTTGPTRDIISETVNWSINDTVFATVARATGVTNSIAGVRETVTPKPTLTVRATNLEGDPVTVVQSITVTPPVILGMASIRSDKDIIEIDESLPLIAQGLYSDGSNRDLTKVVAGATVSNDDLVTFAAAGTSIDGGPIVSVNATSGIVMGRAVGSSTVTATFKNNVVQSGLAFSTTPASASKTIEVKDKVCLVQFVSPTATATSTTTTSATSCGVSGSCRTTNPLNAITASPLTTDSANFQVATPGGLIASGYTLDLRVNGAEVISPTATAPRRIGLVIGVPQDSNLFNPTNDLTIRAFNGTGNGTAVTNLSAVNLNTQVGGFNQVLVYGDVTTPFTGLLATLPVDAGTPLLDALLQLLGAGETVSFEVPVFQVCASARPPTTTP
ncbi:MAG: hypothetical protein Q7J29_09525 [Stagnimonas sp.]|nr:hypothetical protein [Stagnimonas sp.]